MKPLAAIALVVALSIAPAYAQRGGSRGGFSGSHGFSGSSGFSRGGVGRIGGPGSGRVASPPPARFGGSAQGRFVAPPAARFPRPRSGRFTGPPHYISNRPAYGGAPARPPAQRTSVPRMPSTRSMHRMSYDGRHGRHGWDHHRDRDRDRFFGFFGSTWYPLWPWWGGGYPGLFDNWDYGDNYDSQPSSNGSLAQQYPEYAPDPYDQLSPGQPEPQKPATPWPYSRPAPSEFPSAPPAPEAPVTLVFKDGRPNQQIHNYLLTATTLSVLDQQYREIPVNQIDVAATEKLNRESGVEFSLPGASH